MANYLARVAASGASNQPVARPSLIAPPILPGRAPAPDPETPIAPRSSLLPAPPKRPILGEERNLRPQPDQPANLATSPIGQPVVERPAASAIPANPEPTRPVSGPPGERRPNPARSADPNVVRAPRLRPAAAQEEAPRHFDFRPEPDAVVQLPRSLGRARAAASVEATARATPTIEPARAQAIVTPAATPEPVMPVQATAATRQPAPDRGQVSPVERRIISMPQVRTGNVIVEMPNAGPARREPKITIGQIDVQVINTPAAAPQQPVSSPSTSNVTNVELERVRWRPL